MARARQIVPDEPMRERALFGVHIARPREGCERNAGGECKASFPGGCICLDIPVFVDEIRKEPKS